MATVSRVCVTPEHLMANDDRGYQITARLDGATLRIAAECVVVSDSSHVSPRYKRYLVAPRVYDDERVPTLAEIVAEMAGWSYIDPPLFGELLAGEGPRLAREWLLQHHELVLEVYGERPSRLQGACPASAPGEHWGAGSAEHEGGGTHMRPEPFDLDQWEEMRRELGAFQGVLHTEGALSGQEKDEQQEYIDNLPPELREIAQAYVDAGRHASILRIDNHTIGIYVLAHGELFDEEAQATPLKQEATFVVPSHIAAAIEWEAW